MLSCCFVLQQLPVKHVAILRAATAPTAPLAPQASKDDRQRCALVEFKRAR